MVAVGASALYNNGNGAVNSYDGVSNTAIGSTSLFNDTIGYNNTAVGVKSLFNNSSGYNNAAFGLQALQSNTGGIGNTAVGVAADVSSGNLQNATAIGYFATVNASNKVRIGNSNVTVIEGQVNWSFPSDGRFKTNVAETVKGLEFITRLRPVTYNFQTRKYDAFIRGETTSVFSLIANRDFSVSESIRHSGFVAQEVEAAAREVGYDFNGVIPPQNEREAYSLSYSQFVVPLVKAVQEQQLQIQQLKSENEEQKRINEGLLSRLSSIEKELFQKKKSR